MAFRYQRVTEYLIAAHALPIANAPKRAEIKLTTVAPPTPVRYRTCMEEAPTSPDDPKARVIFLFGSLDDEKAGEVVVGLRQFQEQGPEPIQIVLCSTGGGETAGWAIYDAIRGCPNHVTVDAIGSVWSMAVAILQAGDLRRMSPSCRLMVHAGSAKLIDSVDQKTFIAFGREAKRTNHQYQKMLARHTGLPLKRVIEFCDTESFFSAKEALKLGFIDEVLPYAKKKKQQTDTSGAAQ